MEPLSPCSRALLGGILGGLLGTAGMVLAGVGAEWSAGVPPSRLSPELELGFGGPLAGAGVLGPVFSLPIHFLHGVALGLLFVGLLALGDRFRITPRIPIATSGLLFGAVVSVFVVTILAAATPGDLAPGVVALACLLHLTFGGIVGATFEQLRAAGSTTAVARPRS